MAVPTANAMSVALKISRFLGAGVVGLLIDATTFFGLTQGLKVHYAAARIAASLFALTATWTMNRRLAFVAGRRDNAVIEFTRYLIASAAGAAANLAALSAIVPFDAAFAHLPSYIVGAIVGLAVNFMLYDKFVFTGRKPDAERSLAESETKP